MSQILNYVCPGCGAPIGIGKIACDFCDRPIVITSFKSIVGLEMQDVMLKKAAYAKEEVSNPDDIEIKISLAMCLLKLNMLEHASNIFETVIELGTCNSEVYFWNAVCLLNKKRPFMHTKAEVDKAIEYANTARMLENKGIYSYFIAYLKYDYYNLKKLNIIPNYIEELQKAVNITSQADIQMLADILNISEFDQNLSI